MMSLIVGLDVRKFAQKFLFGFWTGTKQSFNTKFETQNFYLFTLISYFPLQTLFNFHILLHLFRALKIHQISTFLLSYNTYLLKV